MVVPMFNEVDRWNAEIWEAFFALEEVDWLFVDDGSSDGTYKLIEKLSQERAHVEALVLPANMGKAEAVRQGILHFIAQEGVSCIGFMDGDGAFSARDLATTIGVFNREVLKGPFDSVWSSRVALSGRDIQRSFRRHFLGRMVATTLRLGLGVIPYDTQSGLKLFFRSDTLAQTFRTPFRSRWLFDVEIMIRWRQFAGVPMKIFEEPLWSWRDVPGSKVSGKEAFRAAREIAVVFSEARVRGYQGP